MKQLQHILIDRFASSLELMAQSQEEFPTLADFAEHISLGKWQRAAHLVYVANLLDSVLEDIERGMDRRIIVSMPPRHGKTELIGVHLPVRYLCKFPDRYGIYCSYAAKRAFAKSRRARDLFREWAPRLYGIRLNMDAMSAAQWHTDVGGGWIAAGVGGGITGEGGHLCIIDDPIKNRQQAESINYRENTKLWYNSVFRTRLEPGGAIIIVMTRWHEDDPAGWLAAGGKLSDIEGAGDLIEFADDWEVIRLPALAEQSDLLNRKQGEALWPDRYSKERLLKIKATTDWYTWAGLFQQRPVALEGGLVKKQSFQYYRDHDNHWECIRAEGSYRIQKNKVIVFQTADLAASEKERASYTVIGTWGFDTQHGVLLLLDINRFRQESPDVKRQLRLSYRRWEPVFQGIEKAQIGIDALQELKREGMALKELKTKTDKITRFLSMATLYQNFQVFHPQDRVACPWINDYEYEILMFPEGVHNDQADVAAYAGHVVSTAGMLGDLNEAAMSLTFEQQSRWRL